jgi:hypothetical protein
VNQGKPIVPAAAFRFAIPLPRWAVGRLEMQLTTSEARAEACTVILVRVLQALPKHKAAWIRARSLLEAENIGNPDVTEEIEFILHGLDL